MKKYNILIASLLVISALSMAADVQSLVVQSRIGNESITALNTIQRIMFSGTSISVVNKDATQINYALSNVQKLLFAFRSVIDTVGSEPDNALNFNGTNNTVVIPDNDNSIPSAFTLEGWLLWQPNANTDIQFICGKAVEQMELHTGAGANALRFIPTTQVYLDVPNAIPTGVWTHIACVYDAAASSAKIYINGNEVSYTSNGPNPVGTALQSTSTPFYLGSRGNGSYYLKGSLDEFRVWSRALSQAEILLNMKTPVNVATQTGLNGYYNFNSGVPGGDNNGQTELSDLTGNFYGTLNNFVLTGSTANWVESYAMVVPTSTPATNILPTGFTANWIAPAVGTVDNYLLDVASDNAFTAPVAGSPFTIPSTALTKTISGLAASTTYYYRVRAEKTGVTGQGTFSDVVSVQTDYTTSDMQIDNGSVRVYPNPATDKLYIEAESLQKVKTVKLYDLRGRLIMSVQKPFSNEIDILGFSAGVFLIEIATENGVFVDKLIKR